MVESEYLGSPITTVPKLDKNPELEDQAEEISDELTEFFLEDQEEANVCAFWWYLCIFHIPLFLNEQYYLSNTLQLLY